MQVLQFKGKTAVESYHRVVPHHALEIDKKLSLAKKPGLDGNLIIEGENLIALKSLLPTHAGRIKCIYIDPPYNTGNEGWVYNDNLTQPQFKEWIGKTVGKEGEDATRHDKWCCMMWPRVQLLRELLRDDGALFVSIDDNEYQHLRIILDEVFGLHNFVATIVWQNVYTVKNSAKYLSDMHDYVVLFAKDKEQWKRNLRPRDEDTDEDYNNPDDDPEGPWISHALQSRNYYSKGIYSIDCPGGRKVDGPPSGTYWRMSKENFRKKDDAGEVWWGKEGNNLPRIKEYLKNVKQGVVPATWWPYQYAGSNSGAKVALRRVMDEGETFVTPKPVDLIRRITELSCGPEDMILDSFAGSGTTAHAVLEGNQEDGGHRRFVLVQMPHDTNEHKKQDLNICERITRERVKRVMRGYSYVNSKGKNRRVPGLGGEFTYARVGAPLFDEHRDFGEKHPSYEDLARYIWFTETSKPFAPKGMDAKAFKIGETKDTDYYLLYEPGKKEAHPLDRTFLKGLKDRKRKKVVYCEAVWMHRDEMTLFGDIRPMQLPFNLK